MLEALFLKPFLLSGSAWALVDGGQARHADLHRSHEGEYDAYDPIDDGVLEDEPETGDDGGPPDELIVLWPQSG